MRNGSRRLSLLTVAVALVAVAVVVPSAGAGGSPSIAFNPTSTDYGTIDAGTTASKTFALTNSGGTGTGALKVSITSTAGSATAFTTIADTCTAVSLGPRKSCSVTVQYAPTTAPQDDAATLTAVSKKPLATATASLTGKSIAPKSQGQRNCEAVGGTFSTDPATNMVNLGGRTFVFSCNGGANLYTFISDCSAAGGNGSNFLSDGAGGYNASCTRP